MRENPHFGFMRRFGGSPRKWATRLAVAATAAVVVVLPAGPAHAYAVVNSDPSFVHVYVNNVENLETSSEVCAGDWQDLIYWMKIQTYSPDLFLVQQIGGQSQLDVLVQRMTDELAGVYAGIVAVPNPTAQGSPCGSEKAYQSTAIIYRTGRFDVVATGTWQSDTLKSDGTCSNNDQSRTIGIKAKLYDKIAGKHVSAASFHWATSSQDGPPCATENIREVDEAVHSYSASLRIFGGDANVSDADSDLNYRTWYSRANGDLGGTYNYRDAMYYKCINTLACVPPLQWTHEDPDRRIDFLFAGKSSGLPTVSAVYSPTWNDGDSADNQVTGTDREDLNYSQHRAIKARIHY